MSFLSQEKSILQVLDMVQEIAANIDEVERESGGDFTFTKELIEQLQEELESLLD